MFSRTRFRAGFTLGQWLLVALACLAALVSTGAAGYWAGGADARAACQQQAQKIESRHRDALAAATARVHDAEQQLRDQIAALDNHHRKELADAKARHESLVAGLRSGTVRVSIPVRAPACPGAAGDDPAAADRAPRAELDPEAAAALAAIAHDGDAAILDLNRCLDAYAAARAAVSRAAAGGH